MNSNDRTPNQDEYWRIPKDVVDFVSNVPHIIGESYIIQGPLNQYDRSEFGQHNTPQGGLVHLLY